MSNEKGLSFIEILLSIVIIICICGTLLPFSYHLQRTTINKELELHASEVALNGVRIVQLYGITGGVINIQQVEYKWNYTLGEICVSFNNLNEERVKCVSI
ncbi:hypothetical protein [Solibacillus sp. CAU 1738]|uniref:hypothetical protein n=1 Tax=Solibacillus sp. CAU 1738 TaxID=3140363 RepID=UPI00326097F9